MGPFLPPYPPDLPSLVWQPRQQQDTFDQDLHVLSLDLDEGRLKFAREMGATHTLKVTGKDSRALAREIQAILGCQPHCSIECSGAEAGIATAIHVRERGSACNAMHHLP